MTARTLRNMTTGTVIARDVRTAATPWRRTVGLLGLAVIDADRGLWFGGCRSLHTIGMRATIDVIFLDATGRVVRFAQGVRANRIAVRCAAACTAIELGSSPDARVAVGDLVRLD